MYQLCHCDPTKPGSTERARVWPSCSEKHQIGPHHSAQFRHRPLERRVGPVEDALGEHTRHVQPQRVRRLRFATVEIP
jgi:hypothetical protein